VNNRLKEKMKMSNPRGSRPLPLSPDDITPEWLNAALREGGGSIPSVRAVEVDGTIGGPTTKLFLRLTFDSPDAAPDSLCIKGVLDDPHDEIRTYIASLEARFFRDVAGTLNIPVFRTWFADCDEHQGLIIFDDLRDGDIRFTSLTETWSPDKVARALEVQAAWHGSTWNAKHERYAFLPRGNQALSAALNSFFSEEYWNAEVANSDTVAIPNELADRLRIKDAIGTLFALDGAAVPTLAHGDAHIGNTYTDGSDTVGFYDWQTACMSSAIDDVTYFMGSALTISDRRSHERDLLNHYLAALSANGGSTMDPEDAWLAYRHHLIHGFAWALIPSNWYPPEIRAPIAERYIAGIQDHDAVTLLEKAAV
jgi:hypothetical protein